MKRSMSIVAAALAALCVAGVATSALAADVAPRAAQTVPVYKAPPEVPPVNWAGFYAGINGGAGFNGGGIGGGQVGYNWQTGNTVFGIETDIGWGNLKPAASGVEQSWLGSTRARLGYVIGRFLPFVTGGVAYGDAKATQPGTTGSTTRTGWTAGGGVEYGINRNWSVKAEYLHLDLGTATFMGAASGTPALSAPVKDDLIRAGLNYHW